MNLRDLIQEHLVHKERKYILPEEKAVEIVATVKAWFKTQGWKVKPRSGKKDSWTEKHKYTAKKGDISIRFAINSNYYTSVSVHQRSNAGGTNTVYDGGCNLQTAIDEADTLEPVVMLSKATLPEPFTFSQIPMQAVKRRFKGSDYTDLIIRRESQISFCRVEGIVGINDKGIVDTKQVYVPGETPYFFLDCVAYSGATFNLISDGDIAYGVKRTGKPRICDDPSPKATINLNKLTSYDQELIQTLMAAYFNKDDVPWEK